MGMVENRELCRSAQKLGGSIVFYDTYVAICAKKGVSPSRAAEDAGISKSLVTKWKNNKVVLPSPDILKKISVYFGIPVSDLIAESENPTVQTDSGVSDRDIKLLEWFHSLPEEKRKAILSLGGAPEDLV